MRSKALTVDQYIDELPEDRKKAINPTQPLPFLGFASQKNFIAIYHMNSVLIPNGLICMRKSERPQKKKIEH